MTDDDRIIGCLPGETPASVLLEMSAIRAARMYREQRRLEDESDALKAEVDSLRAEVEKWKRVAVWALESSAFRASEFGDKTIAFLGPDSIEPTFVDYDGTENGLLAALAKAAGEE